MFCNCRKTQKVIWVMKTLPPLQLVGFMCAWIECIYIIERRALSWDVFPSAWPLNPSYASVYLFATFRCLHLTCVNQSCESEWCVGSHASVSIWVSQQLKGEMPEPIVLANEQCHERQARVQLKDKTHSKVLFYAITVWWCASEVCGFQNREIISQLPALGLNFPPKPPNFCAIHMRFF